MKIWIGVAIALVSGALFGIGLTQFEFAGLGEYFRISDHSTPAVGAARIAKPTQRPANGEKKPLARVIGLSEHDFGTIEQHTLGSHVFKLANEGNAPLKLAVKGTTCKCTVGKLKTNEIAPGEIADIEVSYKAEKPTPAYVHGATIGTNDPDNPVLTFTVKGVVENRVYIAPDSIVFSRISANVSNTGGVSLLVVRIPDFKIMDLAFTEPSTAEFFEVQTAPISGFELEGHPRADSGHNIIVRTKPGLPNGPFRQNLRIKTNSSKDLNLSITGTVIADVTIVGGPKYHVESNLFDLGVVKSKEGAAEKLLVLVKGPNREKIKIKVARVTPKSLTVALGKPTHGDRVTRYPLAVSVAPGSPPANYLGAQTTGFGIVLLETDDPKNKQLKLRVRFAIQ